MKRLLTILILIIPVYSWGQIYESVDTDISLFADAPLQNVEASNEKGVSYFDLSTHMILFDVMIESFQFDQGLMQQHFNDRYMETESFPKAEFFGKIYGFDPTVMGIQEVSAIGEMTIHGITNRVKSTGKMSVTENGEIFLISKFSINISDFEVDSPMLLFHPIAETVDIKVEARYHLTGS